MDQGDDGRSLRPGAVVGKSCSGRGWPQPGSSAFVETTAAVPVELLHVSHRLPDGVRTITSDRIATPLEQFVGQQTTSGLLLFVRGLVALGIANSDFAEPFQHLFESADWRSGCGQRKRWCRQAFTSLADYLCKIGPRRGGTPSASFDDAGQEFERLSSTRLRRSFTPAPSVRMARRCSRITLSVSVMMRYARAEYSAATPGTRMEPMTNRKRPRNPGRFAFAGEATFLVFLAVATEAGIITADLGALGKGPALGHCVGSRR
jgi:hypothetical protein